MVSTMYTARIMAKAGRVRFMTLFSLPIWSTVARRPRCYWADKVTQGGTGDIEVGKSQHQRPYKGHRGHFFGGLAESEDAHQHHDDGAECP